MQIGAGCRSRGVSGLVFHLTLTFYGDVIMEGNRGTQ